MVLGVFAMIALTFIDYHLLNKYKWFIVGGTFFLLALVFVPGLGMESYGAKRWVSLLGFSIQPTEFIKPALILLNITSPYIPFLR